MADIVLMDERKGRREAARLGLMPVGVLGVLVETKGVGLIPAVQPSLKVLREQAGFRFDDTLLHRILARVGG